MSTETANMPPPPPSMSDSSYHDYSQSTQATVDAMKPVEGGEKTESSRNSMTSEQNFPVKLHYMLHELEDDGLAHIVSWAPHGRSFFVHKQDVFIETILNRWFRQTKFASFQRQLNIYGFTRITSGPDKNGYYHEKFLRGRDKIFLAQQIPRMTVKGHGPRRPGSCKADPNFYTMKYLPTTKKVVQTVPMAAPRLPEVQPPTALDLLGRFGCANTMARYPTHPTLANQVVLPTASLDAMLQSRGMSSVGMLSLQRVQNSGQGSTGSNAMDPMLPRGYMARQPVQHQPPKSFMSQNGVSQSTLGRALVLQAMERRRFAAAAFPSTLDYVQGRSINPQNTVERQQELRRIREALLNGRSWPY